MANEVLQRAYASFVLYRIYQDMFRCGRQERLTHAVVFVEALFFAEGQRLPAAVRLAQVVA